MVYGAHWPSVCLHLPRSVNLLDMGSNNGLFGGGLAQFGVQAVGTISVAAGVCHYRYFVLHHERTIPAFACRQKKSWKDWIISEHFTTSYRIRPGSKRHHTARLVIFDMGGSLMRQTPTCQRKQDQHEFHLRKIQATAQQQYLTRL